VPDPIVWLSQDTHVDPWSGPSEASPPRPVADVLREVREVAPGAGMVVLRGGAPARFPGLGDAAHAARQAGADLAIEADPRGLDPVALRALGVELVVLTLHGDPARHDDKVGPGAYAATVAFLSAPQRPRVHVRVGLGTPQDVAHAVAVASRHAERVILDGAVPGSTPDNRAGALEAAWGAAGGATATLELMDADAAPERSAGPVRDLDTSLRALRQSGGWLPGLSSGVRAPSADATERRVLHALGMPARDADTEPPVDPTLTGRVRLVVPHLADAILACSTLPHLARALAARGVDLRTDSVWHAPVNVHAAFSGVVDGALPDGSAAQEARRATAERLSLRFVASLDLSDADVLIAPGWDAAHALWTHPTRRPDARLIVVDLHLEHGLSRWTAAGPGWWPGDAVRVLSCFPAYVGTYLRAGVPADALRWLPYPLARAALPTLTRADDAPWLAAGNQRRDGGLIVTLAERLRTRRLDVLAAACPALPAPHRHLGSTSPAGLAAAVASARAVVLPVTASAHDAAGITLAAMAMATGTPVVGSLAWGLVDHVPSDAGWLVPHDPDALAQALARVDEPEAWDRAHLAAARAGACSDVDAWAGAIATGRWPLWPSRP
jgi:hypothetical protein